MGGSTPISKDQIRKPVFVKIDYKDLVERADPNRHDPELEYEFSNGRRFYRNQTS